MTKTVPLVASISTALQSSSLVILTLVSINSAFQIPHISEIKQYLCSKSHNWIYIAKEIDISVSKGYLYFRVHCGAIQICQDLQTSEVFINKCVHEEIDVCVYYYCHKTKEILPFQQH